MRGLSEGPDARASAPAGPRPGAGRRTGALLLVEDNDVDARVVSRLLRRLDDPVELVRARHGEEALSILRGERAGAAPADPFAVLLDINMPRMTGFDLLDALEAGDLLRGASVHVLTTSNNPQDRETAARYGCVRGYLIKPLDAATLRALLVPDRAPG